MSRPALSSQLRCRDPADCLAGGSRSDLEADLAEALLEVLPGGEAGLRVEHDLPTRVEEARERVASLRTPPSRVHDPVGGRDEPALGEELEHVADVQDDRPGRLVDAEPVAATRLHLESGLGRRRQQGDEVDVLVRSGPDVALTGELGIDGRVVELPEQRLAVHDHVGELLVREAEVDVQRSESHDPEAVELGEDREAELPELGDLLRPDVGHEGLAVAAGVTEREIAANVVERLEVALGRAHRTLDERRGVAGLATVPRRLVPLEGSDGEGEETLHPRVHPPEEGSVEVVVDEHREPDVLAGSAERSYEPRITASVGLAHVDDWNSKSRVFQEARPSQTG